MGWKPPKIRLLALETLIIITGKQSLVVFTCPSGCPEKNKKSWARVINGSVIIKKPLFLPQKSANRPKKIALQGICSFLAKGLTTDGTLVEKIKKVFFFTLRRQTCHSKMGKTAKNTLKGKIVEN